ncbi:MAG: NADH-quinone oxidoreductase subunit J [Deltaproteobacteria bacterium]|nr:NADH-quinone oxidoreductase subunit J [Deltaproteobacteria bacterium]
MDLITFFLLAVPLVLFAAVVILHPSPVYSALSLVLVMSLLAVYFFFLDAHMLGWFQILVYAGAVMVLFLFVIMLLNLQNDPQEHQQPSLRIAARIGGAVLVAELVFLFSRSSTSDAPATLPEGFGTVLALSEKLFTDFLIPFEVTSILLLVAAVGAVVLAKR